MKYFPNQPKRKTNNTFLLQTGCLIYNVSANFARLKSVLTLLTHWSNYISNAITLCYSDDNVKSSNIQVISHVIKSFCWQNKWTNPKAVLFTEEISGEVSQIKTLSAPLWTDISKTSSSLHTNTTCLNVFWCEASASWCEVLFSSNTLSPNVNWQIRPDDPQRRAWLGWLFCLERAAGKKMLNVGK